MKKNGFTLVELMVVIVIVGVLAAIAVPQFGNAIARARAAEVPVNLNKISIAQENYFVETRTYKNGCTWDNVANTDASELGVSITPSQFFTYASGNGKSPTTFVATATLIKKIGQAQVGETVTVNELNAVSIPDGSLGLYLKSYTSQ